ncbi:hypothetical protein [Kitasatospora sp. NPDC096140]|uniref:hypothetical protein n=1 Tax=Kitasatospora sp. NPDC096140 TaxID=3155425 RepID=UPI003333FAC7
MTTARTDRAVRDGRRHRYGHALGVIAVSTGIILGVIAADVYAGTVPAVLLGLLYPVAVGVALASRRDADGRRGLGKDEGALIAATAVAALFACLTGTDVWHNLVLRSGEDVSAVVLQEKVERIGRGTVRSYTLLPRDGGAVPGGDLRPDSQRFKPGDTVTVRVDPAGRVAPELPGEADSPAPLLGFLGLNAAIGAAVLWTARKPRPPHPPGPGRRRLTERARRARERLRGVTGWPFAAAAGALSAAWLGLLQIARTDPTLTVMAAVAYFFVMGGFFGMFDDDKARNAYRARVVLLTVLVTAALGGLLLSTT